MTVRHYSDLVVWQKAMDLVEDVYRITESFPQREIFGITNQMRRASVSIPGRTHQNRLEGRDLSEATGRPSSARRCT